MDSSEDGLMATTMSDTSRVSGNRSGLLPRVRLAGEDDRIDTEGAGAPTTRERIAAKLPRVCRSGALTFQSALRNGMLKLQDAAHNGGLMSAVGTAFLISAVGTMVYVQRAEVGHAPAARHVPVAGHRPSAVVADSAAAAGHGATTRAQAPQATGEAMAHPPGTKKVVIETKPPLTSATSQMPTSHATARSPSFGQTATTPVAKPAETADNSTTELAHFEIFKPGASDSVVPPANVAARALPPAVAESASAAPTPASTPAAGAPQLKVAATAVEAPNKPAAAPAQSAPATPAANPVSQASALKAAPMTGPQQLAVLHLVTELGILVRDQRTEIASLHGQVSDLSSRMNTELTDFDRRLSIAEARGAIDAAMGAGQGQPSHEAAASLPVRAAPDARQVAHAATTPPVLRSVSDYHIQAASPGLAMLATKIGGASRITVGVGDAVPGIGHVKAIFQKGTVWVVETDHGVINQ